MAQDTLPKITVRDYNSRIIVSWKNTYTRKVSIINIQRSKDSLKNFMTIGSVLNPLNVDNGFVDTKAKNDSMFYRIFVVFEGGDYLFTRSHKPHKDTAHKDLINLDLTKALPVILVAPPPPPPPPPAPEMVASKYVFTGKENNLIISLPDAAKKKYSIHIYDEHDNPVFTIQHITEPFLIIEKVNFIHAGQYHYQLFENGNLMEKFRFTINR